MDILRKVNEIVNPSGTPRENYGFVEVNWNAKTAEQNLSIANDELAGWVRANVASVRTELDAFANARKSSPTEHAIRCFIFSIISPQCNFAENVLATQNIMANYDKLTDIDAIVDCLTVPFHGEEGGTSRLVNLGLGKAKYIYDALPWLDRLNDDNLGELFTWDFIHEHKGFGEKTTSMALALFDERSDVFTLDTWMLRLTLALNGHEPRAIVRTTSKGYKVTEAAWLAWCKQALSDLSPFEIQWTLWNGCFGHHVSHLGIIGG